MAYHVANQIGVPSLLLVGVVGAVEVIVHLIEPREKCRTHLYHTEPIP